MIIKYKGNHILNPKEILFIENINGLIKIHREDNETVIARVNFSSIKEKLSKYKFISPHISYLINIDKISYYNNELILINKFTIPISRNKRREIINYLDSYFNNIKEII